MTSSTSEESELRPVTPLGIIVSRLERLRRDLTDVGTIEPEMMVELDGICELAGGLDPYLDRCTTPASDALADLASRTEAQDWAAFASAGSTALEAEMLSGHVEGQALKFLVRMSGATRVLEVGMFTGYSALAMAEALSDGGELVACEIDADVASFARDCFDASPSGDKIDIRVGPAIETLRELADDGESFDLVFIDADKAGYTDYLDAVLRRELLAPGGIVCVDNTLMQGQPYLSGEPTANGAAIASFNEQVVADIRLEQVLLPVRDGLTLIRRADD